MNKLPYLEVFRVAAHWFLPSEEAAEVVDDYWELLGESACSENNQTEKYGPPIYAAHMLIHSKEYRHWLLIFSISALFLITPVIALFWKWHYPTWALVSLIVGAGISLIWFRKEKRTPQHTPKLLLGCLLTWLLLAGSILGTIFWCMMNLDLNLIISILRPSQIGAFFNAIIISLGVLSALFGLIGLVKARISDARWKSMFILCLGIVAMCSLFLSVMHSMSLNDITLNLGMPLLYRCLLTAVVCLGLTGKSLC